MRGDLIQAFKIVNQIDDIPISTFFKMAADSHNHATRNAATVGPGEVVVRGLSTPVMVGSKNFVQQKAKSDIRKNFFSQRVVEKWNCLPNSVKNAKDVNNFKNLYDAHISKD